MKKEFGKWLLDVSKYVTTVVIVSNVVTNIQGNLLYITAGITVTVLTIWGLFLVKEPKNKSKKQYNKGNNYKKR